MNRIRSWIGRHKMSPLPRIKDFERILSNRNFHKLLDYERSRSDRSGREFSVIFFFLEHIAGNDKELLYFIRIITGRVRQTEEIGWLQENNCIGVLLPDTSFAGADKLVKDVLSLNGKFSPPPSYQVYTYPGRWIEGMHDQRSPRWKPGPSSNRSSTGTQSFRLKDYGIVKMLAPHMPLWKRSVDMLGALVGLVLFSPVFILIMVLIKTVSPGPVFFKQTRVGFLGTSFTCLKFRTMEHNADSTMHQNHVCGLCNSDHPLKKLDSHDPRIIPLGRMLRKTGMDELPQLINVLSGEMSLIGPRPDLPYTVRNYLPWQKRRFETYPGLTGLWQVNGKNSTTFNEMMRYDISYVKKQSFLLDSKIFFKTLPTIIRQACDKTLSPRG